MDNRQSKDNLYDHIFHHNVFNTHSHHLPDSFFENFNLTKIIEQGYVHWQRYPLSNDYHSRNDYLAKVRYKSYFIWLEKSLKHLYGFDGNITADNWESIDKIIASTYHKKKDHHLDILKNSCKYDEIILDAYWQPGSNNSHKDIFKSTFRIDPLLQGYANNAVDHDGNNPYKLYNKSFSTLDTYIDWIKDLISKQKANGCIALKSAVAYDRALDFRVVDKNKAKKIFETDPAKISLKMITEFQDYVFQVICELACEHDLPLQCHTGMGTLDNTRAMAMHNIISKNPNTKFVLLHCSFPWTDDICALLHNYPNVYPDLSWLPLLSYTAGKKMLHQLIEIGSIDKICWGCDTRTAEESFGALLSFKKVLQEVLCEKIDSGYFSISNAFDITDHIMIKNASKLYTRNENK